MPRYFFNVYDHKVIMDGVGSELPDLEAVKVEAFQSSIELLKNTGGINVWDGTEWKMVVVDDHGTEVLVLRFSATIPATP